MHDPHPTSSSLGYLSAHEILKRLAAGGLTSLDLVDTLIERIEQVDASDSHVALNSVAAMSEDARAQAHVRDEERQGGGALGALHGIPVLIKDNVEANGLPGLAGSTSLIGRPTSDATLVTRLRDAGAIILGSTNLSEWANIRSPRSSSGYSASGGLVANPWALDRSAGGSSSGSGAALAAGLAPLAVGTETDGSIVCPASVNGVTGLKPTVGVVPTHGVIPISASQDSPGPMGRHVADVALMFSVLAQQEPLRVDATSMVVAKNWRTGHPATDQLFDDVVDELARAGLRMVSRDLAGPGESEGRDELTVLLAELLDDLSAYLAARPGDGVTSLADVIAFEDEHAEIEQRYFGHENFLEAVSTGGRAGPAYAEARQRNLAWALDTSLNPGIDGADVIIAPAYGPSWKSDLIVGGHPGPASPVTSPAAIAGWPILSLPLGLVDGLPVGLAVVGRANDEWRVLDAAARIEAVLRSANPWPTPNWQAATRG
ncbi:MAG TPA: amidase family protein [Acidimicrobiales bacterium]|nr:amidase family protein [Acidimicrobiales bacterium]